MHLHRPTTAILLFLVTVTHGIRAVCAEPNVGEYARLSNQIRAERIENMAKEIERLKTLKRREVLAEYRATRWKFPDQKPTASQYVREESKKRTTTIKRLSDEVARLKSGAYFAPRQPRELGEIGQLRHDVRVLQVVGPEESLVELLSHHSSDRRIRIGKQTAIVGGPSQEIATTYWLKADTSGFRDGQHISIDGFFWVSGNKTYDTDVAGTNTVYVLERIDLAPFVDQFKPAQQH